MSSMLGAFYEFFAGAGMARAGLGDRWRCVFANDFDQKKAATYRLNWGQDNFVCSDVRDVTTADLEQIADLAWASFPCQDLSLAGSGAGLKGERSGTFWPFWDLMTALVAEGKGPSMIVLENVCGTLTSHRGKDFIAMCQALSKGGYRFGALVVDAVMFVPQSRPRLFIIALRRDVDLPEMLAGGGPHGDVHSRRLRIAYRKLPKALQADWIWWRLDPPQPRDIVFADLVEDEPCGVAWHTPEETCALLATMSDLNLKKVRVAEQEDRRVVGTIYKRTRRDEVGRKVQRAEVRFDGIAGCLRTPAGGSSRQIVLVVHGRKVRSRLISSRETARLMGLPEEYVLPDNYNEAYHLTGDGVVVPVVRFLAAKIFEPILLHIAQERAAA